MVSGSSGRGSVASTASQSLSGSIASTGFERDSPSPDDNFPNNENNDRSDDIERVLEKSSGDIDNDEDDDMVDENDVQKTISGSENTVRSSIASTASQNVTGSIASTCLECDSLSPVDDRPDNEDDNQSDGAEYVVAENDVIERDEIAEIVTDPTIDADRQRSSEVDEIEESCATSVTDESDSGVIEDSNDIDEFEKSDDIVFIEEIKIRTPRNRIEKPKKFFKSGSILTKLLSKQQTRVRQTSLFNQSHQGTHLYRQMDNDVYKFRDDAEFIAINQGSLGKRRGQTIYDGAWELLNDAFHVTFYGQRPPTFKSNRISLNPGRKQPRRK